MFNFIIRFSLNNRLITLLFAVILAGTGAYLASRMPIDVLPDLNRPRVVVLTECPGMAPEEVESLVTVPIETYLNGAAETLAIRSNSTAGLSVITIEFNWNTELFRCRQIINERLQMAQGDLPETITPRMIPSASMMGQMMQLAFWDDDEKMAPMDLRTIADWVIRKRILAIPGISEVLVMGGDVRQFQIQARAEDMFRYNVSFDELEKALVGSNRNVTGGFMGQRSETEILVRTIGRIEKLNDLKSLAVKPESEPPILLDQVADIREAAAVKVGSSGVSIKNPDNSIISRPAVVLVVERQIGQDVRQLSGKIEEAVREIEKTINQIHPGLKIVPLYQQKNFIDLAVANVEEALYFGAILIVVVLTLFLMNWRTTAITVLAMPISILVSCLVFAKLGMSINTMTLGGIAIAVGELVDDAIVDVENIYRRLRLNFQKPRENREPIMTVVYQASCEIRNSVVYGTMIVVLVFLPVFFLDGTEGRMFAPMGIAYVVSLLSSLAVSLTVTPILSGILLPRSAKTHVDRESFVQKICKRFAALAIRISLAFPRTILAGSAILVLTAATVFFVLPRDFIPPFNEGAPQVNISLAPGRSLKISEEIGTQIAKDLLKIKGVRSVIRRTGRSEMDEHAVPVNMSEMLCILDMNSGRSITDIFADIEQVISSDKLPGVTAFYDQPLQHTIAHLRTGTRAKIAIKIRGDNPLLLRRRAEEIKRLISSIPDIGSPRTDPVPQDIPQVRFRLKREELARYGLIPEDINATVETAMRGKVLTKVLEGKKTIDVLLRLSDEYREDLERFSNLPIRTPNGLLIPLSKVTEIDANAFGPNRICHEGGQTQITVQTNPTLRGSVDVKNDIVRALDPHWKDLTADGVFIEITGLFQSEEESSQRLTLLFTISVFCIFLVLYRMFRSVNLALQVMTALPLALTGAVAALVLTDQPRSIPALVGMISLCGIASRNGILIIDHYLHLMRFEGALLDRAMILRAGKDRTAPVLMTTLTSVLGLLPITLAPDMPGREILYPIAVVVVGGLISSALMEFFVRPALFWTFGRKAAMKRINNDQNIKDPEQCPR